MTLYEFKQLDEMEQLEAVWESVQIAERFDKDYAIVLYQRDSFYIEVYYNRTENFIRNIRTFANVSQLEPYLYNIDISELKK